MKEIQIRREQKKRVKNKVKEMIKIKNSKNIHKSSHNSNLKRKECYKKYQWRYNRRSYSRKGKNNKS
jgi:hypothetical protein